MGFMMNAARKRTSVRPIISTPAATRCWSSSDRVRRLTILAICYRHRYEGITYSHDYVGNVLEGSISAGFPHSEDFMVAADATWGDRNLWGILIMMFGGSVLEETRKFTDVDSSAEGEGMASSRAADHVAFAREILRAQGLLPDEPVSIYCDNLASVRVGNNVKSSARLRHAARRYRVLQRRVKEGECILKWVSDASNPSDFLTKFIPKRKLDDSVAYAQGRGSKVRANTDAALAVM